MVSRKQKERLKEGLKSYRLTLLENYGNIKPVSYPNILIEFDSLQVRQVLEHCDKLFISDIYNYVKIWRQLHANDILAIIEEVFQDPDVDAWILLTFLRRGLVFGMTLISLIYCVTVSLQKTLMLSCPALINQTTVIKI